MAPTLTTEAEQPKGMGDVIPCACGCGETLREFDSCGRQRRYLRGHHVAHAMKLLKAAPAAPES